MVPAQTPLGPPFVAAVRRKIRHPKRDRGAFTATIFGLGLGMEHAKRDETLTEDTPAPRAPTTEHRAWLIYVGSSENGFVEAGRILKLEDIRSVRFGRVSGSNKGLQVERAGSVLHVGIPLGWVSSAHAELRVVPGSDHFEFDLRDLGSRNGTHIERQAVPGIARILPGQIFEVGRSFWMVREVEDKSLPAERIATLDAVGTSNPALASVHRRLAMLAESDVPLLFRGETGTGKEITARAIHRLSGRKGKFVAANLSAMTDDRADAILFGQGPGAGGTPRPGLFEQADNGTLFLDELGELPPSIQHKLLAAITEGRITREGEVAPRNFDVRVICSALGDVHTLVQAGTFRPDLYSRLAGYEALLPPLRSRREDLGVLTASMLRQRKGAEVTLMTRAFRRVLNYRWPYNIRELQQTLGTSAILAGTGGEISRHVLDEILERRADMPQSPDSVHELRHQLVAELMRAAGDTAKVAKALDREPKEVARWLERFDLDPETYRRAGDPDLVDLDKTITETSLSD